MTTDEELIEALGIIKDECEAQHCHCGCGYCRLWNEQLHKCSINNIKPDKWNIKEKEQWRAIE